jgi:hypothetical protein
MTVGRITSFMPRAEMAADWDLSAESLAALLIGLNMRYKVHGAGTRFNGLQLK